MRELTTPIARVRLSRQRLATAGVAFSAASLSVIAFVHPVGPSAHDATRLLREHSDAELWRVMGAGILAGGWAQWIWSAVVGLAIYALLQARLGRASALGCVAATHLAAAVAAAFVVPMLGRPGLLGYVDLAASSVVLVAATVMSSRLARTTR
jgi:membrane associated rhomboid family serine protease